jgi:hypothetical protein
VDAAPPPQQAMKLLQGVAKKLADNKGAELILIFKVTYY